MNVLMTTSMALMINLAPGSWIVVNDSVMGGRSNSEVVSSPEGMTFRGNLSLENNGGFSSTRRLVADRPGGVRGVRMQVRGDGRQYQVRLRPDQRFDGVSWRSSFVAPQGWQEIELPFDDFEAVFRGYRVPEAGPIDPADVSQVGFLIADKRPGPFQLEIRRLEFF